MSHVIVQLCALNEREHIGAVIDEVPRQIPGVTRVSVLVVDDGSTDGTTEVAKAAGADIVIRHNQRKGLARAFQTGIDACLAHGADIIVNIDADGQYRGADIPNLIGPVLKHQADIVIGDRQTRTLGHFSPAKRLLQGLGSRVVQTAAGIRVSDAVSGFRAYSREAALRIYVSRIFSYTVQSLIQAGKLGMSVATVPITARETVRPSRLHKGILHFVSQQTVVLVRTYITYEPIRTFLGVAAPFLILGVVLIARALFFALQRGGQLANVPSLLIGSISLVIGLLMATTGLIADRVRENRRLLEEILYRVRRDSTTLPPEQVWPMHNSDTASSASRSR
jgi:glycosyltransferase involved in cell wall biosynthesis